MKSTVAAAILATAALSTTANAAAPIRMDIQKNERVASIQRLGRRTNTVTASLGNAEYEGLYYANVSVGTPAQSLSLQIDTGSSDVWLPSSSASLCEEDKQSGCPGGSFDSSASSTFLDVEKDGFNISYVDGTGSAGDYFQDTFEIGGATLKNFEMGLATTTTISIGIMGIGYADSEANTQTGNGTQYPNLIEAMVSAGLVPAKAYSLWLNDLESSTGSILFGGIDTDKFTGNLVSIDVYPDSEDGVISSFTVAFTSLGATSSSGSDQLTPTEYAEAAILDSGTTITLLPDDLAEIIYEELGATNDPDLGPIVPCALADKSGHLTFGFGGANGPSINVPVNELVLPLTLTDGEAVTYDNGQTACQLGIQAAGELPILFGDTFLRSAYVVYDLDNNQIALANTDFNATGSNVVAFASSGAAIPSATTAANKFSVTQTETGAVRGGQATATATASGAAAPTYDPSQATLSAAAGFAATSTGSAGSTSTHKKNAGHTVQPLDWSFVAVLGSSMGLMLLGGGVFTCL